MRNLLTLKSRSLNDPHILDAARDFTGSNLKTAEEAQMSKRLAILRLCKRRLHLMSFADGCRQDIQKAIGLMSFDETVCLFQ